jgi:hypothetical protein
MLKIGKRQDIMAKSRSFTNIGIELSKLLSLHTEILTTFFYSTTSERRLSICAAMGVGGKTRSLEVVLNLLKSTLRGF